MRLKFSKKENTDSALALLLVLLLARLFFKVPIADIILVLVLILVMALPNLFYPFTIIWLNLSDLLGKIMSNVLLFVIYALIVLPIAAFRRLIGKDNLMLKGFKKSNDSVFKTRNHTFTKQDIQAPY
jgi:hypothetical protein